MPASLATVEAILKEVYIGPMRKQLNDDVIALRRVERSSSGIESNVGGKYVTFPIHFGRNSGIGSRAEMADLPKAGHQATAAARIKVGHHYGAMQLSGQTIELADSNVQAFLKSVDLETEGLKTDLSLSQNRQVYGNGAGALAVTGTVTAHVINIVSGMDYLGINQNLDVWTSANLNGSGSATKKDVTITKISDNGDGTGTIQLADSAGADYDPAGSSILVTAGSAREEWVGLGAIVSNTGVLYDVDPADVDQWRSRVDANGGTPRPLSEGLIISNVDKVRKNGGKTSVLLTSLGVRRSYFGLLVQQRKFVNTENSGYTGGFKGLAFTTDQGEIPLISDAYHPYNTLYGLSEKNITLYRDHDWQFANKDGSMWKPVLGDTAGTYKDAWTAWMYQYSQIGTDRRNVHFKITDITEAG